MEDKMKELASEALSHITVRSRESGEEYYIVRTDAPLWVRQLVRHAHDNWMPDDWKYKFIVDSLVTLESGDYDGQYLAVSVYTCQLTEWLASDVQRIAVCDAAREKYGMRCGLFGLLQSGQAAEIREVFNLVRQFLEDMALDEHAATLGAFS